MKTLGHSGIAADVDGRYVSIAGPYSGTTMLFENAGGCVLAAVIAFMARVVVTAAIIKKRNRTENEEKQEEKKS